MSVKQGYGGPPLEQPKRNIEKVRRATANRNRPGEECQAKPGAYQPVVNLGKCEGKKDCVEVCPYGVFAIDRIRPEDYEKLGYFGKLKSRAHGGVVAYVIRGDHCQACGLCVVACPEKAIKLVPTTGS